MVSLLFLCPASLGLSLSPSTLRLLSLVYRGDSKLIVPALFSPVFLSRHLIQTPSINNQLHLFKGH